MDRKPPRLVTSALFVLLSLAFIVGAPAIASAQARSLADAYQIIASKEFVDLTHSFSPLTPVWRGFGPATFSAAADPATGRPYTIDRDGFRAQFFAMVGQYGTHVDPPAHFDPAGATLDKIPVKQMILPLVVFDVTPMLKRDPNHLSPSTTSKPGSRCTAASRQAPWPRCAPTCTRTGTRIRGASSAIHSLHGRWRRSDSCTSSAASWRTATSRWIQTRRPLESETWLLKHGHWQIEVMANLDKVPATGALIVVSWPKPQDGLGFPARAFAILP